MIYKYSKLASEHPRKSQVLLFLVRIALLVNSLVLGGLLFLSDISIPSFFTWFAGISASCLILLYPLKNYKGNLISNTFVNRKKLDFGLSVIYILLVASGFNSFLYSGDKDQDIETPSAVFAVHKPTLKKDRGLFNLSDRFVVKEYRKLKKQFKSELKLMKKELKAQKGSEGNTVIMILLILASILVAAMLIGLTLILACSIACNGSDVLAVIVALLGVVGIPTLLFFTIRSIVRKYRSDVEVIYK
jgi:hypothetical protein